MRHTTLLAAVVAASLLAGCADVPTPRMFRDAQATELEPCPPTSSARSNGVASVATAAGADKPMEVQLEVPAGMSVVRLRANWSAQGDVALEATTPAGRQTAASSPFTLDVRDPPAGRYALRLGALTVATQVAFDLHVGTATGGCRLEDAHQAGPLSGAL